MLIAKSSVPLPVRMLRIAAVEDRTGLAGRTIYKEIADGHFPRPVQISKRSVAWPENEIAEWIEARIAARDAGRAA